MCLLSFREIFMCVRWGLVVNEVFMMFPFRRCRLKLKFVSLNSPHLRSPLALADKGHKGHEFGLHTALKQWVAAATAFLFLSLLCIFCFSVCFKAFRCVFHLTFIFCCFFCICFWCFWFCCAFMFYFILVCLLSFWFRFWCVLMLFVVDVFSIFLCIVFECVWYMLNTFLCMFICWWSGRAREVGDLDEWVSGWGKCSG